MPTTTLLINTMLFCVWQHLIWVHSLWTDSTTVYQVFGQSNQQLYCNWQPQIDKSDQRSGPCPNTYVPKCVYRCLNSGLPGCKGLLLPCVELFLEDLEVLLLVGRLLLPVKVITGGSTAAGGTYTRIQRRMFACYTFHAVRQLKSLRWVTFPSLVKRLSISSFWREWRAWISLMCLMVKWE